jgi:hypothetical protein
MTARKLFVIFGVLSSVCVIVTVWAVHFFMYDMEGVQYIITVASVILILVTVAFVRPYLMNAPVEPERPEFYKELPQDKEWRNEGTRKLILKRKKMYTGSFGKMHVFLGDNQGEFVIKGIKCTEIGLLGNGEKGEYDIPTESVYLFVLASKKYAEDYHSCYQVPRGNKDVELFTAFSINKARFEVFSKQDLMDLGKKGDW